MEEKHLGAYQSLVGRLKKLIYAEGEKLIALSHDPKACISLLELGENSYGSEIESEEVTVPEREGELEIPPAYKAKRLENIMEEMKRDEYYSNCDIRDIRQDEYFFEILQLSLNKQAERNETRLIDAETDLPIDARERAHLLRVRYANEYSSTYVNVPKSIYSIGLDNIAMDLARKPEMIESYTGDSAEDVQGPADDMLIGQILESSEALYVMAGAHPKSAIERAEIRLESIAIRARQAMISDAAAEKLRETLEELTKTGNEAQSEIITRILGQRKTDRMLLKYEGKNKEFDGEER